MTALHNVCSVTASIALSTAAAADITGIAWDSGTSVTIDGVEYVSYSLYAISDDQNNDVVVAISGLGMEIGVDAAYWSNDTCEPWDGQGSGFWNATGFASRPVLPQLPGAPAHWKWDTMLTIGVDNLDPQPAEEAELVPGTTVDLSGPGPTIMSQDSNGMGSIFITPENPVGRPDANGQVLIGRFTIRRGEYVNVGFFVDWGNYSGRGVGHGYFEAVIFPSGSPADLNYDDVVDVFDLLLLLGAWGTEWEGADLAPPYDVVDVQDLLILLSEWGKAC